MEQKVPLAGLLPEEIAGVLRISPPYRGAQIFKALWAGIPSISEITTLSKTDREYLEEKAVLLETSVEQKKTDEKGTSKLVITCRDGYKIEAVILSDGEGRKTLCLSTQAGCGMSCNFCRTGLLGFTRDLSVSEITEQVLHTLRLGEKISNLVFMGMGEPLLNLNAVIRAAEIFTRADGLGIGFPRMTLSTCGIVEGIGKLTSGGPYFRLAVSLNSANQNTRSELMPVAAKNTLTELKKALLAYQEVSGKRITFEYIVLPDINDRREDVKELLSFCRDFSYIVNVIPWNPVEGLPFREPTEKEIRGFLRLLDRYGIKWTRRYRKGGGIDGACGQLGGAQGG